MKMANMDDYFDVVIVGTGAAGLYCALNLPARYRILLLTKQKADESDSFLAQGGICMQHGGHDNVTVGCHYLTGHAAGGIMLQTGVQHAVGNEVAQLVGMPAHNGFCGVKTGMLVFLHGFGIFKNVVH